MRLIATLKDEKQARLLSHYLKAQGIENQLDISVESHADGSDSVQNLSKIWVVYEEQMKQALEISHSPELWSGQVLYEPYEDEPKAEQETILSKKNGVKQPAALAQPLGLITFYILLNCCLLFFLTESTKPLLPINPEIVQELSLPGMPLYYSSLGKSFLFDYPRAYEYIDELATKAQEQNLQEAKTLPKDLMPLVEQYRETPYWKGFYDKFLFFFQGQNVSLQPEAPLFEKIQQGEWWRLISPIFLHGNIFHLLFNMLWLVVLGRQIESQLGIGRYLFFIILTAIITNISQYLMSGSNFLGFSGVICAMITFVWARQRKAPWEGYLLQPVTFNFTVLFLGMVLFVQMLSFYSEIVYNVSLTPLIANTAHMTGLLAGLILGNMNFFAWKFR